MSFGFPYLDITTLSVGTSTAQFPLAQLHLCRKLPYSSTEVIMPCEKESEELKAIHSSRKHCGKGLRRTTTCPILCWCWSLPPPPILIENRAHRLGRGLASAQLWSSYKTLLRPKLNFNESWPTKRRGWLGNRRTDRWGHASQYGWRGGCHLPGGPLWTKLNWLS